MTSMLLHQAIERLANLVRAEARRLGARYGLQPVQMDALHYLGMCNRYSDTPQAVSDYLGITKGTVSQTLNILETKGLISKVKDTRDRRVVHLCLTPDGTELLQATFPAPILTETYMELPLAAQQQMASSLRTLLQTWQRKNGFRGFGQCKTCRFHQQVAAEQFVCGLTQERLTNADIELICREHAA